MREFAKYPALWYNSGNFPKKEGVSIVEITLKSGSVSAAVDSFGAELISLKDRTNMEYIWQRDPAFWGKCAPVLFPIVGRLRNGKTVIEGQTFEMGGHGFASRSEFEVCERTDDSVWMKLSSSEETKRQYPYDFELRMGFTLCENGLRVSHVVRNTDQRNILFGIGGHPAFNCPLVPGETFEDYQLEFSHPENGLCPGFEDDIIRYAQARDIFGGEKVLPLKYSLFDEDAIILEKPNSGEVALRSRVSGRGLNFDFSEFEIIAFWTPVKREAPFLCIEPWFGMGARDDEASGDFVDKKGMVSLPAGETFSASYTVSFLPAGE